MHMIIKAFMLILCSSQLQGKTLTKHEQQAIGEQIWFNEAGKNPAYLVYWNKHEAFPSLGIGHFTWQPKDKTIPYQTVFPSLCHYLKQEKIKLPNWLNKSLQEGCAPWRCRNDFLQDTQKCNDLTKLMLSTVNLQAMFMVNRLELELNTIVKTLDQNKAVHVRRIITLMTASTQGMYALVDYLNFKGSGMNPQERVQGVGWGLRQVLERIPNNVTKQTVLNAFVKSAEGLLRMRVALAGDKSGLQRFLAGWINRVRTYTNTKLFSSITNQSPVY